MEQADCWTSLLKRDAWVACKVDMHGGNVPNPGYTKALHLHQKNLLHDFQFTHHASYNSTSQKRIVAISSDGALSGTNSGAANEAQLHCLKESSMSMMISRLPVL